MVGIVSVHFVFRIYFGELQNEEEKRVNERTRRVTIVESNFVRIDCVIDIIEYFHHCG